MDQLINRLPSYIEPIKSIKETIIANILLIGQIPSPTFHEYHRAKVLMERLAEFQVDECSTDSYQNPIGIIRGTSSGAKPPIFLVSHLDTVFDKDIDHNFVVKADTITGPGIMDNSAGVGVLASIPEILRKLGLRFESDIVLAGVIQSLNRGNCQGIRQLLKSWPTPIRGAICIEGGELGRLNYYSDSMIRFEIECDIVPNIGWVHRFKANAILILNDVINEILKLSLPQRPMSRVIIGKISGGFKHGVIASDAQLGCEIQSSSDQMVKSIYNDIKSIVEGISHEYEVDLSLKPISNRVASRLPYSHPLIKTAGAIMTKLGLHPFSEHSESELSIFLSRGIPAVTLGITHGENYHLENASMEIEPMFTGIAQIIGVLMAIDSGVCDEQQMA